ncbi:MAG TPA: UbiA-like polyprenyltransferase [Gemmatimonadaceae bacterium]|nr:UbiA-like polyprenyltransferase [Gemmatimonadaceae bacterium]
MTGPSAHREGQTFAGASRLVRYVNFVKLPHTVFALPFALVGVTLATYAAPLPAATLGWVVLAFTAARFAAMGFNRIADRGIDARNPRTAAREIPSGAMTVGEAWALVLGAVVLFELAAWKLNPLCFALSPVALAWVFFYSFTKRFTRWSHLVLGLGMAIAPVGGYLALTGRWSDPWWLLPALACAVMTWGAGFDVMYALQDVAFDRAHGLRSLPAAIGARAAIRVARALHALTVLLLVAAGLGAGRGWIYGAGVAAVLALLAYEHSLVSAEDQSKLDAAFFTMNGVISIVLFAFVLAERLLA